MVLRTFLVVLLIFVNTSDALAKKSLADLEKLAQQYVQAINNGAYEKAALQLYYPEVLQGEEKEKEIKDISKSLSIFSHEFGDISNLRLGVTGKYYSALVMAGSLKFWSDKMDSLNLKYQVVYTKQKQSQIT